MLTGKKLGAAIEAARIAKGVSKADIARHFQIKAPSISDWVNKGTIDKARLPALWQYFADVVGPTHWGMDRWPVQDSLPAVHEPSVSYSLFSRHVQDILHLLEHTTEEEQCRCVGAVAAVLGKRPPSLQKQHQRTGT